MSVSEGSILRVVPTFTLGSVSKAQNVYHVRHESVADSDDDDVLDAALELIEDLMGNFDQNISDEVELASVEVFELILSEWQPLGTVAGTWAGAVTTDRVPSGVALLINLYKERTNHKDRKFIAGLVEVSVNGDEIATGVLTNAGAYVTTMTQLFTAANGVELRPIHYNRNTGAVKVYNGGAGSALPAYQRRRKPGVGLT